MPKTSRSFQSWCGIGKECGLPASGRISSAPIDVVRLNGRRVRRFRRPGTATTDRKVWCFFQFNIRGNRSVASIPRSALSSSRAPQAAHPPTSGTAQIFQPKQPTTCNPYTAGYRNRESDFSTSQRKGLGCQRLRDHFRVGAGSVRNADCRRPVGSRLRQ